MAMRAITILAVVSLPALRAGAVPPNRDYIVTVHLGPMHPLPDEAAIDAAAVRKARRDAEAAIAAGAMIHYDPRIELLDEQRPGISAAVRAEVLKRYGITEEWLICPLPGGRHAYQRAYNDVIDAALRERYGPGFWERVDREVRAAIKRERRRTPPRFPPDPPPGFFIC